LREINLTSSSESTKLLDISKILELINTFEQSVENGIELSSVNRLKKNFEALKISMAEAEQEKLAKEKLVESHELLSSFETDFDTFTKKFSNKFTNLLNLTRNTYENWEKTTSVRDILKLVFDKFFEEYRAQDIWLIDIFDQIINDIQMKTETLLIDTIEKQIFDIKNNIDEIKKVPDALEQQYKELFQFLKRIKEVSGNKSKSVLDLAVDELSQSKIDTLIDNLSQCCEEIPEEINNQLKKRKGIQLDFLMNLRNEINSFQKSLLSLTSDVEKVDKPAPEPQKPTQEEPEKKKEKEVKQKKITKKSKPTKKK